MSAAEFTRWMAYYKIAPFGDSRNELHAGIIASTMANAWSDKDTTFQPIDFMVVTEVETKESQVEKTAREIEKWVAVANNPKAKMSKKNG